MISLIRSHERYHTEAGWLSANWHFSFDHYYDPQNVQFGPLRVFNDDTIAPESGFDMHPHREMEIVTYVVRGQLLHRDSAGHQGILKAGGVQHMSAGTGVYHSEVNPSATEPLRLCQIWLLPAEKGLAPSYEDRHFSREERQSRLLSVVSNQPLPGVLTIHQDATFYISALNKGDQVEHHLVASRKAYLFVIEGGIDLNGFDLRSGDQARITETAGLAIRALEPTELILIDLP